MSLTGFNPTPLRPRPIVISTVDVHCQVGIFNRLGGGFGGLGLALGVLHSGRSLRLGSADLGLGPGLDLLLLPPPPPRPPPVPSSLSSPQPPAHSPSASLFPPPRLQPLPPTRTR